MQLSQYQRDILDYVSTESGNLIVQACAGSGKTTTLREICQVLPRELSVIALCFNKINAVQFGEKLPKHVEASTMHSCGLKIIRHHTRGVKVDTRKMDTYLEKFIGKPKTWSQSDKELAKYLRKVIPLVRSLLLDINNLLDVEYIFDNYIPEAVLEHITVNEICVVGNKLLKALRADRRIVDFDDMLDHVVYHELEPPQSYDVILGDEVQDWNKQQARFVELMACHGPKPTNKSVGGLDELDELLASTGTLASEEERSLNRPTNSRVILVGDKNQSIYAFRGADTQSMENLKSTFECEEFPLSVCYRCPTKIVAEAQKIVGDLEIQPCDGADEGVVVARSHRDYADTIHNLPDGAMVLCRTNAPLLPGALQLVRDGRKACVRGRDIASNLIAIIKKFEGRCDSVSELLENINKWGRDRYLSLMKNKAEGAAQSIMDQIACIRAVAEECDFVDEIRTRIDRIFSDEVKGVVFSSAHRSKGLEADHVVILGPEKMPHPMALKYGSQEALKQEDNLFYVAVTRSMDVLVYQPLPINDEPEFGLDDERIDMCMKEEAEDQIRARGE